MYTVVPLRIATALRIPTPESETSVPATWAEWVIPSSSCQEMEYVLFEGLRGWRRILTCMLRYVSSCSGRYFFLFVSAWEFALRPKSGRSTNGNVIRCPSTKPAQQDSPGL